jgi:hypothetical protein
MLADLATIAVTGAFLAPLLLIGIYSLVAPWWASQVGRNLVTVEGAVSLALLPPFWHRITGPAAPATTGFLIFQAIAWGVLALVLLRMSWVIIVTQQRGRLRGRLRRKPDLPRD